MSFTLSGLMLPVFVHLSPVCFLRSSRPCKLFSSIFTCQLHVSSKTLVGLLARWWWKCWFAVWINGGNCVREIPSLIRCFCNDRGSRRTWFLIWVERWHHFFWGWGWKKHPSCVAVSLGGDSNTRGHLVVIMSFGLAWRNWESSLSGPFLQCSTYFLCVALTLTSHNCQKPQEPLSTIVLELTCTSVAAAATFSQMKRSF